MKLEIYKNAWKIFVINFWKLFSFSFAIMVIIIALYLSSFATMGYDFGLIYILGFAFVLLPLFFSFQIAIAKASSGQVLNYSDLYSNYKLYLNHQNRGSYSIIFNVFVSIIVSIIIVYLGTCCYEVTHKAIYDATIEKINSIDGSSNYSAYVNTFLNMPDYIYFILASIGLSFLYFIRRIKRSLMIPYFNLYSGVPNIINRRINKQLLIENKTFIRSNTIFGNIIFSLSFLIGFILAGFLMIYFNDGDYYLEVLIACSLSGGLFLSMFVLAPSIINHCFVADALHVKYLRLLKKSMLDLIKSIDTDSNIDEDKKNEFKKMLDVFDQEINDDEKEDQ